MGPRVVPNPTIFLDIDGVMRSLDDVDKFTNAVEKWEEPAVTVMKYLIKTLNADIVLSTGWRTTHVQEISDKLSDCQLPRPVAVTPDFGGCKEREILSHVEDSNLMFWVAIDDANLDLPTEHFYRTSKTGLCLDDAPLIAERLQKKRLGCCAVT